MPTLAAVRPRFTRQPDKQADVAGTLHAAWSDAKDRVAHYEAKVRGYESELREQAGEAPRRRRDRPPRARPSGPAPNVNAPNPHLEYPRRTTPHGTDGQ